MYRCIDCTARRRQRRDSERAREAAVLDRQQRTPATSGCLSAPLPTHRYHPYPPVSTRIHPYPPIHVRVATPPTTNTVCLVHIAEPIRPQSERTDRSVRERGRERERERGRERNREKETHRGREKQRAHPSTPHSTPPPHYGRCADRFSENQILRSTIDNQHHGTLL